MLLIITLIIGSALLLTQCSKSKNSQKKASEKPVTTPKPPPVEVKQPASNEAVGNQPKSKEAKSKKSAEPPKGKSSEVEKKSNKAQDRENERQRPKSSEPNKKTSEAPSSNKPSRAMDGTQIEVRDKMIWTADECDPMEDTVYDFETPVVNEMAKKNTTAAPIHEVKYMGNIDDDVAKHAAINAEIVKEIAQTWPAQKDRALERRRKLELIEKGEKVQLEDSVTEKSVEQDVSGGKKVTFNNKNSVLWETKEQYTEELEYDEGKDEKK